MSVRVEGVPPDAIAEWWPTVCGFFRKAGNRFPWSEGEEAWKERAARKHAVLWLIGVDGEVVAAMGTTLSLSANNDLAVFVDWCGGSGVEKWRGVVLEKLRSFAEAEGAVSIQFTGRMGWARGLKWPGLRPIATTFELRV